MKSIGLMQGRLVPPINGRIQFFPTNNWRSEFPKLKKLGIRNLEWTFDQQGLLENPILTNTGWNEIQLLCKSSEVIVSTATCDNLMNAPIHKVGPDGQTSDSEFADFIDRLGNTSISLIIWPLVDAGALSSLDEAEDFLAKVSKHFERLEDNNVRVAFETDLTPHENMKLLQSLPSHLFGLNLDIGNSASYGNSIVEDWVLNHDRILNIHVKDRIIGGPTVALGTGDVAWGDVRKVIAEYNGLLIMQCARIDGQPETETIAQYLEFLKKQGII